MRASPLQAPHLRGGYSLLSGRLACCDGNISPLGECLVQVFADDHHLGLLNNSLEQSMKLELYPKCCQHSSLKRPLVLAVEDDEDNLLLVVQVLTLLECSFVTATEGQEALVKAQTYQPDLILLDIMLPQMSGIEVLEQLKQNPRTMKIPIIAVTAMARAEDRDRVLGLGCNDFISKPYMIDELEAIIGRYLS